jgi:hypothetical protein
MADENVPKSDDQDVDIKPPSGIGMKIGILVAILAVIGGGVAAWYFLLYKPEVEQEARLKVHVDFWNEFTRYHAEGYGSTWSCIFAGTEESQVNTNLKLEQLIDTALSQNEAMFGKLIIACVDNDEGMLEAVGKEPPPSMVSMEQHAENLRQMDVPPPYQETFEGLPETLEEIQNAWRELGQYFMEADERAKWDTELTEAANNGWGQLYVKSIKREKPKASHLANAWRYYKFMTCALGSDYADLGEFKTTKELEALIGKIATEGECSTEEKAAAYFPTIDACAKEYLLASKTDIGDAQFQNAIKEHWYDETRSLAAIAGSWEDPETGEIHEGCIRKARAHIKATGISHLFKSSMAYSQSRIELSKIYKEQKARYEAE